MRPSPIGPFWWAQRFESAPICVPSRNTAMRSPSRPATMRAPLSGIESGGPTASQPSLPQALARSLVRSRHPAMRWSNVTQPKPLASIATMNGLWSYCMAPSATCITTSPYADVERHVQILPDRRREEDEPIVVAGRRHQKQNEECGEAQRLEGKTDELAIVGGFGQFVVETRQRVLHRIPFDHERGVQKHDEEGQHAEMAPVVQQRQKPAIEPRQRPDREDRRQHQEGAGTESAD